jgi:predicted transcriptional regulator YheO
MTAKRKAVPAMVHGRKAIFQNLEMVAAVLVETLGRNCEVAIHDFAKLPHSLIHVEGDITKRKPGAPVTDLVVKTLRREGNEAENICNYKNTTKLGRILKSSTAFIRDGQNKVIGAFCVNIDITDFLNSIALIGNFVRTSNDHDLETQETFASSLNETIESLIDQAVQKAAKQPAVMTKEEKLELVSDLEIHGAFSLKGAVHHVATLLGVSRYTMYNYIKSVRSSKNMI